MARQDRCFVFRLDGVTAAFEKRGGEHGCLLWTLTNPTLAYSGTYEVLAWVAPTTTQSSAVSVTIRHAQGETAALVDETAGEVGWHSLGVYTFDAGEGAAPCSRPRATAPWWPTLSNG